MLARLLSVHLQVAELAQRLVAFGPFLPGPPPLAEPPCRLQPKAVEHDEATLQPVLPHKLSHPGQQSLNVLLKPLQSNMVEITFTEGTEADVHIVATGAGLRYRTYLDLPVDVDNAACRSVPDGPRTVMGPLPAGAKAYVLVSNARHEGNELTTYTVSVGKPE